MIFFWDKCTPKSIPVALQTLNLPVGIEWYLKHWPLSDSSPEGGDDRWLSQVGAWGWTVISQDYHFHERESERYAISQHRVGCFYIWGAQETKWEILRCFARGYDNIVSAAEITPRPFVYWVTRSGTLRQQPVP